MLNNDFPSRGIGKDRLLAFYTSTICGGYHSVPPPIMSTTPPAGASRERQCPDDSEHRRQCDNPCLAGGYDAPQVECAAWIPERNLTTPGRFLSRGRQRVGDLAAWTSRRRSGHDLTYIVLTNCERNPVVRQPTTWARQTPPSQIPADQSVRRGFCPTAKIRLALFRSWSRKGWEFESPRSHKGCEVAGRQADYPTT